MIGFFKIFFQILYGEAVDTAKDLAHLARKPQYFASLLRIDRKLEHGEPIAIAVPIDGWEKATKVDPSKLN